MSRLIGMRPGLMEIVKKWEKNPDLAQIFQGMCVVIGNRAGSYSGMFHAQRVTMSVCIKITSPKASAQP